MTDIDFEKKKALFLKQKKTLDLFLKTGAISQKLYGLLMISLWKKHDFD